MTNIRLSTVDVTSRLDDERKRLLIALGWAGMGAGLIAIFANPFIPERKFVPWISSAFVVGGSIGLVCVGLTLKKDKGFRKGEELLFQMNHSATLAASHYYHKQSQQAAVQGMLTRNIQPAFPPTQSQQVPAQKREDREVQPASSLSSAPVDNQTTRQPDNQETGWTNYQGYVATEDEPTLFDWNLFNSQPERFPHIFVVGGTGDGKSFTTECLATLLDGTTIISHPHRKPSDFVNFPVFCGGRNYGSYVSDKPVDFSILLTGKNPNGQPARVSCASLLKTLCAEMATRFDRRELGDENFPLINVVLDETNTMMATLKGEKGSTVAADFASLVREARKVKIRLFCLVQGTEVKSLGMDGEGTIRNSFRYVRLGDFARKHAKSLGPQVQEWINGQRHPMLVEDEPARLPIELVETIQESINQKLTIKPAETIEAEPATNLNPREWPAVIYPGQLQQLPAHQQGVYAVFVGSQLVYIGESSDLWRRWNWREKPHHIRKDLDRAEEVVKIHFYTLESSATEKERKDLETQLQIQLNPPWNGTGKHELPTPQPIEEASPQISVEDLLQLVLEFAKERGGCTVREVQNLYRIGQKYRLKAPAIKGIFKELESRGLGSVSEETVQGQTQVKFVIA